MAQVSGERAPAFTSEELERLVDGVLPQYTLLYGPPDKQVRAHQKKGIWCAIAKEVWTLGVLDRQSTHCRKCLEDLRHWARKTAEAQLGLASQRGRGACRTLTPLLFRILAVAYPELDGRLKASQQPQGSEYRFRFLTLSALTFYLGGGCGLWVPLGQERTWQGRSLVGQAPKHSNLNSVSGHLQLGKVLWVSGVQLMAFGIVPYGLLTSCVTGSVWPSV
ncbi:hypothetical protein NDU88_004825 [Pleurodeles waltl]|uniref:Myb/SANT-like DNA-binding domain-containing protein n=1 Tax=Pleurodeles waltl TaxID=8319 RepID=A0AAV7NNE9_PLEWA|nr:hypothetical protein NDU88_004825 [Pleurodeles waltl]